MGAYRRSLAGQEISLVITPDEACPGCEDRNFIPGPDAVKALVDQIPISLDLKADGKLIDERLTLCSGCDALKEKVLCAHCGCFVLFRTRARKSYCPHPGGGKWGAV